MSDFIAEQQTMFITISKARANLPKLVNKVKEDTRRFLITVKGQPTAALISLEELEALEETAEILAIPEAKKNIRLGIKQIDKGEMISLQDLK